MGRVHSEHELVDQDLDEIARFIAWHDPDAAHRVIEAIVHSIYEIHSDPERYPV